MARTTPGNSVEHVVELKVDHLTATVAKATVGYRISEGAPVVADGTIVMSGDVLVKVVVGGEPVESLLVAGEIETSNSAAKRVLRELARAVGAVQSEIHQTVV